MNDKNKNISILGLITARGGSKGLSGKNIKPLAGKPLIVWTIEAALQSTCLDRVVVSTDEKAIADIARDAGASVPFLRPPELATDDSPHILTVIHTLDWLAEHENYRPDAVCLLQPTSPLRTAEDIDKAAEILQEKDAHAVIAVTLAAEHPVLSQRIEPDGRLISLVPCDVDYPRRQDLPPAYSVNGAIFLNRTSSLREEGTFYPDRKYACVMPPDRSLQIDIPWDFHLVELVCQNKDQLRTLDVN